MKLLKNYLYIYIYNKNKGFQRKFKEMKATVTHILIY